MRKLAIIVFLFLEINSFGKVTVYSYVPKIKLNFELIINTVAKDLNIDTANALNIMVCYMYHDTHNTNKSGLTQKINENTYVINIKYYFCDDKPINIFLHEMVHVAQMEIKRLKQGANYIYFEGVLYTGELDAEKLPFEIEAMDMTEILISKYRKQF